MVEGEGAELAEGGEGIEEVDLPDVRTFSARFRQRKASRGTHRLPAPSRLEVNQLQVRAAERDHAQLADVERCSLKRLEDEFAEGFAAGDGRVKDLRDLVRDEAVKGEAVGFEGQRAQIAQRTARRRTR